MSLSQKKTDLGYCLVCVHRGMDVLLKQDHRPVHEVTGIQGRLHEADVVGSHQHILAIQPLAELIPSWEAPRSMLYIVEHPWDFKKSLTPSRFQSPGVTPTGSTLIVVTILAPLILLISANLA